VSTVSNSAETSQASRLRYHRAGLSAAAGALERMTTIAAAIVRVRILVEAVGASGYGTWVAILGFAQAGRMLNGGTHYALVNRFAEASLDHSGRAMRTVLSTAFFVYLAIALIGATIGCGLVAFVPLNRWLGQSQWGSEAMPLLAICIVWVFAAMPTNLFGTLLVGTQRQYVLSVWGAVTTVVQVTMLWIAVRSGWHSLISLGLIIVVTDLASSAALAIYVASQTGLRPSLRHFDRTSVPPLFTDGFCFMAADVGNWLKLSLPSLLIAGIAGPAQLAEFAIVLQLCQAAVGFIALIGTSLWPAYAQSASAGDQAWLAAAFSRASAATVLLAGWSAALLLIFGEFTLQVWLHGRLTWAAPVAVLLALWMIGQSFALGAWTFLAGVSRMKEMAVITIVEGGAVSLGSVVLIRWLASTGVAMSMAVAVFISAGVLMLAVRRVVPQVSCQLLSKSAVVAIGVVLATFVVRQSWTSTAVGIRTNLVEAGVLSLSYVVLTWYGVATADHRRRAKSLWRNGAGFMNKRRSMERFARPT
jgi:O-antigen/teichoic acid export membrane protein